MTRRMRDFALEVHFSRWEFNARFNLAGSDAESMSLRELLALGNDAEREAFEHLHLGYTETFGAPALREAVAGTYETVSPQDVLCCAGAEEALYIVNRVLLEPGDHAIVITPNYQSAETVPLSACEVTGVPLDIERAWDLDVDRLVAAMRRETKLVSINFPNNPTGRVLPRESFDAIVRACRERGIWLFSDEVYRLLEHDPSIRLPQAVDVYERAISLNVLSKAYGLPGLRIGWLACRDRSMLQRFERYKHFLSICNAAPSEVLACIALGARGHIVERNQGIIAKNLDLLDAFFADFTELFEWRRPDASCIAFIRYRGADGVAEFTRRLVEQAGVLILPASIYRSELSEVPGDCMRIGFGKRNVPDALELMRRHLEEVASP